MKAAEVMCRASNVFWNIPRYTLMALIRVYQLTLSPLLGARCKYYPSCSAYGMGAMKEHGAFKGTALTGWRIMRCNPWSKGGLDPVPDHGHWLPNILPNGDPRPSKPTKNPESARVHS